MITGELCKSERYSERITNSCVRSERNFQTLRLLISCNLYPCAGSLLNNPGNIFDKPHIEHTIDFIENENFDLLDQAWFGLLDQQTGNFDRHNPRFSPVLLPDSPEHHPNNPVL